jgi:N-acetylneuraminate synthase/sialic acid synthase
MNIQKILSQYGKSGVFCIAEIGNNHKGDFQLAKELIDAAVDAGASAVKFQKRSNQTLFQKDFANQAYIGKNSFGDNYLKHREAVELSIDEMRELRRYSYKKDVLFFATPFDSESLQQLENIDSELYKVASADIVNHELLHDICDTKKPLIVSTGGATQLEVDEAVELLKSRRASFALLHCTAAYPVEPQEMELRVIETFKAQYPSIPIGLSDHQSGISMATVAYMLGARIFEKHFTLHRSWKGTDQSFSLEPQGFKKMVRDLSNIDKALGDGTKKLLEIEKDPMFKMRKSIIIKNDTPQGTTISRDHLEFRCPWNGLSVNNLLKVVGRTTKKSLTSGHVLSLDDLE